LLNPDELVPCTTHTAYAADALARAHPSLTDRASSRQQPPVRIWSRHLPHGGECGLLRLPRCHLTPLCTSWRMTWGFRTQVCGTRLGRVGAGAVAKSGLRRGGGGERGWSSGHGHGLLRLAEALRRAAGCCCCSRTLPSLSAKSRRHRRAWLTARCSAYRSPPSRPSGPARSLVRCVQRWKSCDSYRWGLARRDRKCRTNLKRSRRTGACD
jgi:hypothetical protein